MRPYTPISGMLKGLARLQSNKWKNLASLF